MRRQAKLKYTADIHITIRKVLNVARAYSTVRVNERLSGPEQSAFISQFCGVAFDFSKVFVALDWALAFDFSKVFVVPV